MPDEKILEEKKDERLIAEPEEPKAEEPQAEELAVEDKEEAIVENPEAETPAAAEPEKPEEQGLEETPEAQAEGEAEPKEEEQRMFTQEQVNELVGKARAEGRKRGYEQAKTEALQRYNVDSDDQLDSLFANGSRYTELSERFKDSGNRLKDAQTELALVKSRIVPERQSDVKAILGANGLEVTEENIAALLPTHPEWTAQAVQAPQQGQPQPQQAAPNQEKEWEPQEPIDKLGIEPSRSKEPTEEEQREKAMKMFFGNK